MKSGGMKSARYTQTHERVQTVGKDEVAASQTAVKSAQRLVEQTQIVADKAAKLRKQLQRKAREATATARQRKSPSAKRSADEIRRKLEGARIEHRQALGRHKEAKALLSEQRELAKLIERKQIARERAVEAFLKKWNREYDRRLGLIKKNAALRRKWLQQ